MKKSGLLLLFIIILKSLAIAQITITGTVISSDDNLGLPGAAVIIKGTTTGTMTDIDGKYKINVNKGATLVFSFVGMKPQEFVISDQTTINVTLGADVFKMEEVVVAGVASATPKRKLSVSVSKVGSDELEKVPATSAATALQGKVAGLVVVNASGNPGQTAGIRLRGSTSLLSTQSPLIIVDGVMMEGELSDINVDDIADMQVVKGAAASALYGSRAGSGVIVITTKRGGSVSEGNTEIKVRNEYGVSSLIKEINLAEHHPYMLADDYKQKDYTKYYGQILPDGSVDGVIYPADYHGGGDPRIQGSRKLDYDHYADNPYSFNNDLQKEIFPNGNFYTNFVSIANNNNKTSIMASFENNHNSGIVFSKKGLDKQNFRFNIDCNVYSNVKLSTSTFISQTQLDLPNGGETVNDGGGASSAFSDVLFMNPDVNLNMNAPDTMLLKKYYFKPDNWALAGNPKHSLYYDQRTTDRDEIMQNISVKYNMLKWMEADADYSFEKTYISYTDFDSVGYMGNGGSEQNGFEERESGGSLSQTIQTTLNINQIFGNFTTKAKFCYLLENYSSDPFYASGLDFASSGVSALNAITGNKTLGSQYIKTIAENYFGILDLDYKGKLMTSMLYRYDGSSLFGSNSRWNPYYRISGAYRIGDDLKIPNVQELKLRASVGTSGQRPEFEYQYETYAISSVGSLVPATSGNKNLKPSETQETEFAISSDFFDRFEAEVILSNNKTTRAFVPVPLPAVTSFEYQWQNAASLKSTSFECTLGVQAIKSKDLNWNINVSFDKMSQIVDALNVPPFQTGPEEAPYFYIKAGEPFGIMYGYDWVKSLQQMEHQLPQGKSINDYKVNSDGYVILKGTEGTQFEAPIALDQNNDNSPDFVKIADMNPRFNMSFSTTITWKHLSLNMLWNWKNGGNIYNMTKQYLFLDQKAGVCDQYGKPEYEKKTIDYYSVFYDARQANTYFVEDASFLKLRELGLYYDFGGKFLSNTRFGFIKEGKIGILGRNLLTFTKYTGWDPEVSSGNDLTNYVIDIFNYPNYRTITVSLELKF